MKKWRDSRTRPSFSKLAKDVTARIAIPRLRGTAYVGAAMRFKPHFGFAIHLAPRTTPDYPFATSQAVRSRHDHQHPF